MTPTTKKIGSDYFVVYPTSLLKTMHLKIGMKLNLNVENGWLVVVPVTKKRPVYKRNKMKTRKIMNQSTRYMRYLLHIQKVNGTCLST